MLYTMPLEMSVAVVLEENPFQAVFIKRALT
jgi:hypothetical protein